MWEAAGEEGLFQLRPVLVLCYGYGVNFVRQNNPGGGGINQNRRSCSAIKGRGSTCACALISYDVVFPTSSNAAQEFSQPLTTMKAVLHSVLAPPPDSIRQGGRATRRHVTGRRKKRVPPPSGLVEPVDLKVGLTRRGRALWRELKVPPPFFLLDQTPPGLARRCA